MKDPKQYQKELDALEIELKDKSKKIKANHKKILNLIQRDYFGIKAERLVRSENEFYDACCRSMQLTMEIIKSEKQKLESENYE